VWLYTSTGDMNKKGFSSGLSLAVRDRIAVSLRHCCSEGGKSRANPEHLREVESEARRRETANGRQWVGIVDPGKQQKKVYFKSQQFHWKEV